MGKTAAQMGLLKEEENDEYLEVLNQIVNKELKFKLRGTAECFKVNSKLLAILKRYLVILWDV